VPYLELNRYGVAGWDRVTEQVNGLGFLPIIMAAVSAGSAYLKTQQARTAKGIAAGQTAAASARDQKIIDAQSRLDAANAAKAASDAAKAAEAQAAVPGSGVVPGGEYGGGGQGASGLDRNSVLVLGLGAAALVTVLIFARR
jgi:hypothetical protein